MIAARSRPAFRARLLAWYGDNRRALPWRATRGPYRIWLSEVMLQQTRVAVVEDYYRRFLRRFPTVRHLARTRLSSVLAEWSGLGYYRRARALHAAARKIVREQRGRFPQTSGELLVLPGIGRYTAAAIASIAFGEPVAVLDGNVQRVLQRMHGHSIPQAQAWRCAEELLDHSRPGDFNQAMMELGATVCLPRQPRCSACPVAKWCSSSAAKALPTAKTALRRRKALTYALVLRGNAVQLVRRALESSLMPGMWELPQLSRKSAADEKQVLRLKHSITTTDYHVTVVKLDEPAASGEIKENGAARWVPLARAARLPLTGLTRKVLRRVGVLDI